MPHPHQIKVWAWGMTLVTYWMYSHLYHQYRLTSWLTGKCKSEEWAHKWVVAVDTDGVSTLVYTCILKFTDTWGKCLFRIGFPLLHTFQVNDMKVCSHVGHEIYENYHPSNDSPEWCFWPIDTSSQIGYPWPGTSSEPTEAKKDASLLPSREP